MTTPNEKHKEAEHKEQSPVKPAEKPLPSENQTEKNGTFTPATRGQKWFLAIGLWIATGLVCLWWFCALKHFEERLVAEHSVEWSAPANIVLKAGPSAFRYDCSSNLLCYSGPIDSSIKQELVALLVTDGSTNSTALTQSYICAVSKLANESNDSSWKVLLNLLLVGALSSTLGGLLQCIVSFVNVHCYKKELDLVVWWPYYLMRPIMGFLIGIAFVLLVKSDVLFKGEATADGSLWWAGVALLAGFGTSDFTTRLVQLSRALFGGSDIKSNPKTK